MQIVTTLEQRVGILFAVRRLRRAAEVIVLRQAAGVRVAPKES